MIRDDRNVRGTAGHAITRKKKKLGKFETLRVLRFMTGERNRKRKPEIEKRKQSNGNKETERETGKVRR